MFVCLPLMRCPGEWVKLPTVLLCFIDPRVRKIRNEASSCLGIFSRTLRFTMSLAPPVHPSPIFLTDTEN